jgi:hypothetical protein
VPNWLRSSDDTDARNDILGCFGRSHRSAHRLEVLGSERLTGASLDRLTHRCTILETNGESYRLRDARRRRGSPTAQTVEA